MKTTVEIPADLVERTRLYAEQHGKTFKQVLVDSLERTVGTSAGESKSGWELVFGCSGATREELVRIQSDIDEQFGQVDMPDWK